jgi:hypothetical protein
VDGDISGSITAHGEGIGNVSTSYGTISASLTADGSIDNVTAFDDISGAITAEFDIGDITATNGDISGSVTSNEASIGSVTAGSDLSGTISADTDIGDVTVGNENNGDSFGNITANRGNIGAVTVYGELDGAVSANGSIGAIWTQEDINGDVTSKIGAIGITSLGDLDDSVTAYGDITVNVENVSGTLTSNHGALSLTAWDSSIDGQFSALHNISADICAGPTSPEPDVSNPDAAPEAHHKAPAKVSPDHSVASNLSLSLTATEDDVAITNTSSEQNGPGSDMSTDSFSLTAGKKSAGMNHLTLTLGDNYDQRGSTLSDNFSVDAGLAFGNYFSPSATVGYDSTKGLTFGVGADANSWGIKWSAGVKDTISHTNDNKITGTGSLTIPLAPPQAKGDIPGSPSSPNISFNISGTYDVDTRASTASVNGNLSLPVSPNLSFTVDAGTMLNSFPQTPIRSDYGITAGIGLNWQLTKNVSFKPKIDFDEYNLGTQSDIKATWGIEIKF